MDAAPRFQDVEGGLVGCQPWTAPFEGAFTRAAKIALVNALDARALSELLFGRRLLPSSFAVVHGRSFLNGVWAAPTANGSTGQSVLPGFLTHLCGGWATAIAGDARLRLCPTCADVGYQSVLFQIDALSACPIHGEPLVDACVHCHAPTPRYALCPEAFLSPMQCTACGMGYGRAWNDAADFGAWTGPGDLRPLRRLALQLQSWQSFKLEWPSMSNWVDDPSEDPAARRRIHVFHALETVASAQPQAGALVRARTALCVRTTASPPSPRHEARLAIYKSIRRHIFKRLGIGRMNKGTRYQGCFYLHRVNEAIVPKAAAVPPALHALVLWMHRCEDGPHVTNFWLAIRPALKFSSRLRLRTRLLLWPTEAQVPDALWGHFVWSSFLEDLWTARRWQAVVAPLGDPLEQEDLHAPAVKANRAEFLARLATWTPKLSPLMESFPSGLSHFTWQQGRGPRQLSLVTIQRFQGAWHVDTGTL